VPAGKTSPLRVVVTADKKPVKGVRVVVRGAGVSVTAVSNGKGVAVVRVKPRRSGILEVTLPGRDTCRGARQVGVVAPVLLPPVTG